MRNPNRPSPHSRAERVLTGTLVGTGIGIAAELATRVALDLQNPYMSPLENYLYLPTRFALFGTAFGLGKADFASKGQTQDRTTPFLIAGAIGIALDVGETLLDKIINPNLPLTSTSLLLAANTGALMGIAAGYNYLWGRKSRPFGLDR